MLSGSRPGSDEVSVLILTDLDGSLLDPDYSYEKAKPALRWIEENNHRLIFVTSKTFAEICFLQEQLGLEQPFIGENGGGIFFPLNHRYTLGPRAFRMGDHMCLRLGRSYAEIRRFFTGIKVHFGLTGFGDISDSELAGLTGLALAHAARARQRDFSEPFLIEDEAKLDELRDTASHHGFDITKGGHFFHITARGQNKGSAVMTLKNLLDPSAKTISIGDAENDIPMLRAADIPIQIPRPDGSFTDLGHLNARRARWPGSRGWNDAILSIAKTSDLSML